MPRKPANLGGPQCGNSLLSGFRALNLSDIRMLPVLAPQILNHGDLQGAAAGGLWHDSPMGKACVRLIIRSHEELDASAHGNRTESTKKPQQRPPAALHQPEGLKPARGQILSTECNFSCPSRASSTVHSPRPRPPGLWPAQPAQPSMAVWCSLGGGFCKGGQKGTSPQARRAGRPQTNTSPLPMQAHGAQRVNSRQWLGQYKCQWLMAEKVVRMLCMHVHRQMFPPLQCSRS